MAFELKHGATCGNGAITAVVTKEDNDAFSSRADDVFSMLQTRLEATAVPLPSSDEDDEDLHPLCGAKVSNPKKTVLHQHHMKLDDSSKSPKQPCATSKEPKRREKKVRFAITTSDPDDDGGATKAKNDGSARHTGVVTRWDNGRGFGFIKPDQGGKDVFCHVTVIQDGNSLQEGSKVSYVAVYDGRRRKYRAENLTGGVTVDRVRPREVIQALRDESRFTHYSLEGVDVSNSSNTKAAVSFLHSRKPQPAAERHICEVGSVKFKPRDKRTHSPANATASKKSGSDPAAATGPRLSHLGSVETFETDSSPMGAAPADNGAPLLPPAQSSVTQFKKKKKKKKNKVQRRARTLQTF